MSLRRLSLAGLFATFGLIAIATAGPEPVWEFSLIGDMYPPGRSIEHPTPEKPTFYYPVVMGFEAKGAVLANDPPPSARDMVHNLAVALAGQNYLASRQIDVPAPAGTRPGPDGVVPKTVKAFTPPPTVLLILQWGSIRAQTMDDGGDVTTSTAPSEVLNKGQMLGLTAGRNLDMNYGFDDASQKLMQNIGLDRYFVIVSAYDYDAYFKRHKRVVLWVSKLSVPSEGENMANVMPNLIKQGAVVFGQETQKPKMFTMPAVRTGTVTLGPAVEVPAPAKPADTQTKPQQ